MKTEEWGSRDDAALHSNKSAGSLHSVPNLPLVPSSQLQNPEPAPPRPSTVRFLGQRLSGDWGLSRVIWELMAFSLGGGDELPLVLRRILMASYLCVCYSTISCSIILVSMSYWPSLILPKPDILEFIIMAQMHGVISWPNRIETPEGLAIRITQPWCSPVGTQSMFSVPMEDRVGASRKTYFILNVAIRENGQCGHLYWTNIIMSPLISKTTLTKFQRRQICTKALDADMPYYEVFFVLPPHPI